MGATYTRQSTFTDGDTITAELFNTEFDQLVAAFAASTGHSHDGTAGEGGPVAGMLSHTLTFGAGTSGTDIVCTFNGESNNGIYKWMEDEDYFEFSDDILIASTEKIQFRDTAIYINSSVDGQLDIVADTEIQIAATTIDINGAVALNGAITGATNITLSGELDAATLDISGNADIDGNLDIGGNLVVTGTTTFNGGTLTLGDAASDNVVFGADVNSSIIPNTDDTYDLGSSGQQWKDIYIDGVAYLDAIDFNGTAISSTAAELNLLDGVSGLVQADFTKLAAVDSTAAELNIVDGGTSATSTTVVDADRVVLNDNGTMVQVAVTDLAAYFDDEITAMPNLVTTAATTVGALDSGSITSNFGTIDTGSSTITTTGLISGGSLDIDNVLINGTTIGHTDDTDLITLANGVVTVAGEISMTTLDIGGTNVTSTAAELNLIDGGTSRGTTAVASGDGLLVNDDGTMRMTNVDTVSTYFASHNVGGGNIVTTGALNSGSITSGFGTIDTGSSAITTTGLISGGSLDIDNVLINGTTIGHTDDTDLITLANGLVTVAGEVQVTTLDIGGTNVTSTSAELNLLDGSSANSVVNSKAVIYGSSGELAGTLSTAAQTNVTSLGTLTALAVDDVAINGKAMTMTGSSSDTAVFTVGTNGTLSIVTTDDAAAAANIQITADGTAELAGTTVTLDSGGDIDLSATNDVNLPANVGLTFGDDGEKIEWDGTNLAINSSGDLNVTATTIDIDGNVEISGTAVTTGVHTFTAVPIFPNNTVETADIQADAITGAKIADDAIDSEHYTDGSIDTAHIADNQVTLAKMAGIARGKIIYGDASGDPAVLTAGSNTTVLTSDGTDISWASGGGGGVWTFIASSGAISDETTVSFTQFDASEYDTYIFSFMYVKSEDDNKNWYGRVSTDGGSNYDSTATNYHLAGTVDASGYHMTRSTGAGNEAAEYGLCGTLTLFGPHLTSFTMAKSNIVVHDHISRIMEGGADDNSAHIHLVAADVDAIQFLFSTGNITSGEIMMYGLKNA